MVSCEAVLTIDNSEGLLRPGMTATASIVVDRREKAILVPNAALRFLPPGAPPEPTPSPAAPPAAKHVYVLSGNTPTPVTVKVGVTDGNHSEVLEGDVHPGGQVVVDAQGGS